MPMHKRLAVRLVGKPYNTTVAVPAAKAEDNVIVFGSTPKQKTVTFQRIEYISARTVVDVPVSEIYEPREPEAVMQSLAR